MSDSAAPILVVDDEPMVREVVRAYLERDGFTCIECDDGSQVSDMVRLHTPQMIVLDIMLPGKDGYSVLSEIREASDVPVILLSARSAETDRLLGLELGADDYVVKPFSAREVAARVRTVLRRTAPPEEEPIKVESGDLVVDGGAREVWLAGEPVTMPPLEFDLLLCFVANPRRVFTRAELLESVWGSRPEWQDASTVTVHVRRLRQKIEADPDNPQRITTVWGKGYRFEG